MASVRLLARDIVSGWLEGEDVTRKRHMSGVESVCGLFMRTLVCEVCGSLVRAVMPPAEFTGPHCRLPPESALAESVIKSWARGGSLQGGERGWCGRESIVGDEWLVSISQMQEGATRSAWGIQRQLIEASGNELVHSIALGGLSRA